MVRRRALAAGLAALALAPLATARRLGAAGPGAATASPLPSAKGTATMEQDGLILQASLAPRPEAGVLDITYRVENHRPGPAYVYDKIIVPAPEGGLKAMAGRAYVYPRPDAGEVLVMKDVAPVPRGLSPTSLVAPLMLRLGPGETLDSALELSLPLRPWREYVSNALGYPQQQTVEALRLRIGYALPPAGAEESSFDYAGETADNFRNPPGVPHKAAALELRFDTPGLPVFLPD